MTRPFFGLRKLEKIDISKPIIITINQGDMKKNFTLENSGQKDTYESGSVRDKRDGKGRYDLITPVGLRRLARVYELGAKVYGDRNWELGMPLSRFLDSLERHINEWKEAKLSGTEMTEDKIAQAAWNIFAIMHFEELRPDLDDISPKNKLKPGTIIPVDQRG